MTSSAKFDRRSLLMAGSLLALCAPRPGLHAAPMPRIKVLIVDGVSNHDWALTTKLVRAILDSSGLFEVTVSTSPPTATAPGWDAWRPDFKSHDVVVQTYNDLNGGPMWPEPVKADFVSYVKNGGGVFVLHAGNNAFGNWPEYNEIIGLAWRPADFGTAIYVDEYKKLQSIPPGQGERTGHGKRLDALVQRLDEHPVHAGFPRAWLTADVELYRYARGPARNLTVLTYALEPATQKSWPMEWTVDYGSGRAYVANYGHVWKGDVQPVTMRSADVQTILIRALQWLAKRPVTWPVPDDFPTAAATSVRALAVASHQDTPGAPGPWRTLLDERLSAWEVWIGSPHVSVTNLPEGTPKSTNGRSGPAMGLGNDPKKVFSVRTESGEPVLYISGEIYGGLTTRESFANYHFRLDVKWGEKKWEPRLTQPRDSGLLYHCTGPHGAFWNAWKRCLELQVQENDMGDLFLLAGVRADVVLVKPASKIWTYEPKAGVLTAVGAGVKEPGSGRVARLSGDFERPNGEWNTIDLYVVGSTAVHVVNGQVVLVLRNAVNVESPTEPESKLESGQLQIQSEAAEVYYRRIQIRPIARFPAEINTAAFGV